MVKEVMHADVFSGALFLFIGKRYDTMKLIYWDRNGFAVWHKLIESNEHFHWPRLFAEDTVTLTAEQLNWLMDGYDVWAQPHRTMKFMHVS